jgi:hypothetical protein
MARLRGLSEMLLTRQGDEVLQLTDVHVEPMIDDR